ncbi:hypothetical protein EV426DRAFT_720151 [Tirmania nivea]|nr:hypothetical protein EV426DRAFT_720151 [Tirmania nivea]
MSKARHTPSAPTQAMAYTDKLTPTGSFLHAWLRTNRSPFNSWLHTIGKRTSRLGPTAVIQWRTGTTSPSPVPGTTNSGELSSTTLQPGKIWTAPSGKRKKGIEAFFAYLYRPLAWRVVQEGKKNFVRESELGTGSQKYGRWIRDITPGVASISSRQNGFLLRADIHIDFDNYLVSVDLTMVTKSLSLADIDGSVPILFAVIQQISQGFRRTSPLAFSPISLANLRSEGEPIFKRDFPVGTNAVAR